MIPKIILHKISDYEWEIPQSFRDDMRVPVRFFATEKQLDKASEDLSLVQAINCATLPGLVGQIVVMPDMHQGYGFPIGGVAATILPDGVISPGAIGYDINCGVRLLASSIRLEEVESLLENLAISLDNFCPSGVGSKGNMKLTQKDLEGISSSGLNWMLQKNLATTGDIRRTEDNGSLVGADFGKVSPRARERAAGQLGTLGSGNHFLEIGVVDKIYDQHAAQVMGLEQNCLIVLIHSGSRGFGHQVCTDNVREFQTAVQKYRIQLPDRELVCAPLSSVEGQNYLAAMRAAANYAFANRQLLANQVRQAFDLVLAGKVRHPYLHQVYDIAHNIGKIETQLIHGERKKLFIHRKGATRAFGANTPGLPEEYQSIGQPVLVPGSMGTASWVLVGSQNNMERSFGSCCHGAGRVMSRSQAKHKFRGEKLHNQLLNDGIRIRTGSLPNLSEEAPQAYKNVDEVVDTVCGAGIARKVARLRPVVVIKG